MLPLTTQISWRLTFRHRTTWICPTLRMFRRWRRFVIGYWAGPWIRPCSKRWMYVPATGAGLTSIQLAWCAPSASTSMTLVSYLAFLCSNEARWNVRTVGVRRTETTGICGCNCSKPVLGAQRHRMHSFDAARSLPSFCTVIHLSFKRPRLRLTADCACRALVRVVS